MQRTFTKISLLLLFFLVACGGGKKLAKNPRQIGLVPVQLAQNVANEENVNAIIFQEFQNSGVLFPQLLDTTAGFWTISRFKQVPDSLLEWMVTIKIDDENQAYERGTKIPFLVYKPQSTYNVRMTYRLFHRGEEQYADIGELNVSQKQAGDYQMLAYDESDPSLSLSGPERFQLRRAAYRAAAQNLISAIAKKMKVK